MLGDAAVAVNPSDERFKKFVGRSLWHPFRKERIPIVFDELVQAEFGTGKRFLLNIPKFDKEI